MNQPENGQYYTIKELVEAKGTSLPVRSALLAMESRILALEHDLATALEGTQHMTPRERTHAAIDAIAQEHGYTVGDILGKSRLKHLVAVRRLCIMMLRERGYSTTEIGRLMDRDHSTIVHAINKPVDMCNDMVVRLPDQQRRDDDMINWTKDERTVALLPQVIRHMVECDEFSLGHEAQLNLIREEYLADRLNDYRGESADGFEDWHGQPTIEDFIEALLDA